MLAIGVNRHYQSAVINIFQPLAAEIEVFRTTSAHARSAKIDLPPPATLPAESALGAKPLTPFSIALGMPPCCSEDRQTASHYLEHRIWDTFLVSVSDRSEAGCRKMCDR
jgi:hypothetical protein